MPSRLLRVVASIDAIEAAASVDFHFVAWKTEDIYFASFKF